MALELRVAGQVVHADAALFDKDGTLIDLHAPWAVWGEAVVTELMARQPTLAGERLRAVIGLEDGRVRPDSALAGGTVDMLADLLAAELVALPAGDAEQEVAAAIARADARVETADYVTALPGAVEVVRACHAASARVALVTADTSARARAHLGRIGLEQLVRVVIGADEVTAGKPDPEALLLACERLAVAPQRVVFFGDSEHDAVAAERAGVAGCVLVRSEPPEGAALSALWAPTWAAVAVTDGTAPAP